MKSKFGGTVRIKSIQRGSVWFRTGEGQEYAKILEELKTVGIGGGKVYEIVVYRCYNADGELKVEIESNSSLLITYTK